MSTHKPIDRNNAEERLWKGSNRRSSMGRTSIDITCPFCGETVTAYVWSLSGGGKRCPCGAKHGSTGLSRKNKPATAKETP